VIYDDPVLLDCCGSLSSDIYCREVLDRSEYLSKFKKMGIEAALDDVVTSAVGAARYIDTITLTNASKFGLINFISQVFCQ
jgi:hypothetical protein